MTRILVGILVLVVLVIGLALVAPMFIPADVYRAEIEKAAKEQTGRELKIAGDLGFSFFPSVAVKAGDVTFANADWASEPVMASMKEMKVGVKLLPLLSGGLEVERFVLIEPVINLEVDKKGRANWEFSGQTAKGEPAPSGDPAPDGEGGEQPRGQAGDLILGDVRIVDGRVSYVNQQTGAKEVAEDIALQVSLPGLRGPFNADGSLVYNGEPVSIDIEIQNPKDFLDGAATDLALALDGSLIEASLEGSMAAAESAKAALPFAGNGTAKLDIPSVRKLMAWLGQPMAGSDGFGPLKIGGQVGVKGDTLSFSGADLAFDGMKGTGDFAVNLGGARPKLSGTLDLDKLDARPYAGAGGSGSGGGGSAGGGGGGKSAPSSSGGWSDEPIDLSVLKAVDADFALKVGQIFFQDLKIGESALALAIKGGRMTADLSKLALYEGGGSAKLVVDARQKTPAISSNLAFNGIAALPLLRDAIDVELLEGIGNLELQFQTRGGSQKALVNALDGSGKIFFNDGAIFGINLAEILRGLGTGDVSALVKAGAQGFSFSDKSSKTDFAELSGTFNIVNGTLQNPDAILKNPLLRVLGNGVVNLAQQRVEYRLNPTVVGSLEGQGSSGDLKGLSIPLLIKGSFSDLSIGPDGDALAKGLLGGLLGGGKGEDGEKEDPGKALLKGLLGGGSKSEAPAEGSSEAAPEAGSDGDGGEADKPKPEDLLKGIFGG